MRKTFSGTAVRTTTTGSLTNVATGAVLGLSAQTNWPTAGPFVVILEPGTLNEELVLCDSRSGATVTINAAGRGYTLGGVGVPHASGVPVHMLVVDYTVIDETSAAANTLSAKGDLLGYTGSVLSRFPIGAVDGQALRKLAAGGQGFEWNVLGSIPIGAPAGPVEGQGWYDNTGTESEGLVFYDGASNAKPWNMAWGLQGQPGIQPGGQSLNTAGDVTGMSVTFIAVLRRWYRYTVSVDINNNASSGNVNTGFELRDQANATIQAWSVVTQGGGAPANQHYWTYTLVRQESPGLVTRKIWSNGFGVAGINYGLFGGSPLLGQLWCEDIGPVTGVPA